MSTQPKLTAAQVVAELDRRSMPRNWTDARESYVRMQIEWAYSAAAELVRENLLPTWLDAPTEPDEYYVEGIARPMYVYRDPEDETWLVFGYLLKGGEWVEVYENLNGRRVCPIGERPSEATQEQGE